MTDGKWCKMGLKSMRNSSMEWPPIFILKKEKYWKNLFIFYFLKNEKMAFKNHI